MKSCIGWDVGGAHLKAVLLNAAGEALAVRQVYCPLWQGLEHLKAVVAEIQTQWNADFHAVTMTGELADIFPDRQQGVVQIVSLLSGVLNGEVRYYAGKHGLIAADMAGPYWAEIASMNWLTSVQFVALHAPDALFVDIGSTTTDIVLIGDAKPSMQAYTDATRMQCDELVYTGVVRTPLMALARQIKVGSKVSHVAAEYFATTADIYTLSGDLSLHDNVATTADGADKSMTSCARRIARMVGYDANDAPLSDWKKIALEFKQLQLGQIRAAMQNQLTRVTGTRELHIIGAGAGSFLVEEIARQLGYPYQNVQHFIVAADAGIKKMSAVCFPAYAVAYLAVKAHKVSV